MGWNGKGNTVTILTNCDESGIAARLADAYQVDGYADWYLPTIVELYYAGFGLSALMNFPTGSYCSSTEFNIDHTSAWSQDGFGTPLGSAILKSESSHVLPMKPF